MPDVTPLTFFVVCLVVLLMWFPGFVGRWLAKARFAYDNKMAELDLKLTRAKRKLQEQRGEQAEDEGSQRRSFSR